MKSLALSTIVVFGFANAVHAEIVTVPFEGIVTMVFGTPFGVTFEPNVTPVTGSFKYDTATPPIAFSSVDSDFLVSIPNGFVLNLPGVILSSSNYNINLVNDNNRLFDLVGIQSGASGHGSDFRVNGVPAPQGGVYVYLADVDNTIFPNSNSLRMLPTQSQVDQLDFIDRGLASDGSGSIEVGRVPEPCALLLAAQLLCMLGVRRARFVYADSLGQR
jgi:hypothetical protein